MTNAVYANYVYAEKLIAQTCPSHPEMIGTDAVIVYLQMAQKGPAERKAFTIPEIRQMVIDFNKILETHDGFLEAKDWTPDGDC